ncbi:hypothetical protein [uncultured Methanobrevibacter sp.]|uniref:hypothetical protein n=1 Tax=uncultured Methanobrevibacter sp. TaxID=253161 RepID=UPI0025CC0CA3|nr:hypothetical protein [uncultured Methanobrevibacter sp.]
MENETNQLLKSLHINEQLKYDESIPILENFKDAKVKELSSRIWHLESDTYILIIDFNDKTYKNLTKPYADIESEGYIFNFHGEMIGEISNNPSIKNSQAGYNIKLPVGKSPFKEEEYYWQFANTHQKNYNIIIEGKSSKSKYALLESFIVNLSRENIPSIIIDTNNHFKNLDNLLTDKLSRGVKLTPRQVNIPDNKEYVNANIIDKVTEKYKDLDSEVYKKVVEKASHKSFNTTKNIKKANPKLPFNPFKKYSKYSLNGFTLEDNPSVARRFIRIVNNVYDISPDELNELYFICLKSLEKYRHLNLDHLKNELDMIKADSILSSLKDLFVDEPFAKGGKYDWSFLNESTGKVKIIDLSQYTESTQKFIYDIILYDLYNFKITEGFFDFPFFTVLDNSQNINFSSNSIINKLLVNGKEYGFSIALLMDDERKIKTSTLNTIEDRIYFASDDESIDSIVEILDNLNENDSSWKNDLLNLDEDQYIVSVNLNSDGKDSTSSRVHILKFE